MLRSPVGEKRGRAINNGMSEMTGMNTDFACRFIGVSMEIHLMQQKKSLRQDQQQRQREQASSIQANYGWHFALKARIDAWRPF